MPCVTYNVDIDQINEALQMHQTYYIGNGKIKEISARGAYSQPSKYQVILNRSSFISHIDKEELPIPTEHLLLQLLCADMPRLRTTQHKTIFINFFPVLFAALLIFSCTNSNYTLDSH